MIAVDTSALMAVALDDPAADVCSDVLANAAEIIVSAGTLAETLIVARHRNVEPAIERLISGLGCQVAPVSELDARKVAEAYGKWGKGVHQAGLNYGDCFGYALATQRGCPLLFAGNDFSRTDVARAF
jgi:ribonuclease VapC